MSVKIKEIKIRNIAVTVNNRLRFFFGSVSLRCLTKWNWVSFWKYSFLMAASNHKPSRPKNSNFTVLDSNVKLRGFRKSKNRTKKLNSDLFNYSRLYTRCLSFLKILISVVLTLSLRKLTVDFQTAFMVFRNNTWNMVPINSSKIHIMVVSSLHSDVKLQAESKAS